jgi:hypothetical protein
MAAPTQYHNRLITIMYQNPIPALNAVDSDYGTNTSHQDESHVAEDI